MKEFDEGMGNPVELKSGTLLAVSFSGCADRIRLLLAARKLAQDTGREFCMAWCPNLDCVADFHELFEMQDCPVTDKMPEVIAGCYFDGHTWSRIPWAFTERQIKACDAEHITLHSFALDQSHNWEVEGQFTFSKAVRHRFYEWTNTIYGCALPDCIGCHVRRGDKTELPPIQQYFEAIDRFPKAFGIFLATDDMNVRWSFEARYGERLFYGNSNRPSRLTKQGMIDAMAELAVLRQCRRLVLSGYSGFSMMAIKGSNSVKGPLGEVRVIEDNR